MERAPSAHEQALAPPPWPGAEEDRRRRTIIRAALATAATLHVAAFLTTWPSLGPRPEGIIESGHRIFVLQQVRFRPRPPSRVDLPEPPARSVPIPDATPDEPEVVRRHPVEADIPVDPGIVWGDPGAIPAPPPRASPEVYEVGRDIAPPRVIHRVDPVYTKAALAARLQGVVILEAVIDTEGRVSSLQVLRGLPLGLTESALDAVRRWRFKPSTAGGRPVSVIYRLTVVFRIQ